MNCPSPLALSMHADGALPAPDAEAVERHTASCAACRRQLADLRDETRQLSAALRHDVTPAHVPAFRAPVRRRRMLWAAAVLGALLSAGPLSVWTALTSSGLPAGLTWLKPFGAGVAADIAAGALFLLLDEGASMMTTILEALTALLVAAALLWGLAAALRFRRGSAALLAIPLAALVLPSLGQALEIRRAEGVLTVPAGETIDDTLLALGESVEIDGTVNGDLIVFGRHVEIRGSVEGQVLAGAQSVNLQGDVGGTVLGFAETLGIARAGIGRNLFGFGREVRTSDDANIEGNAVVFAENGRLEAPVGIDVVGFANELALSGRVDGDVTAFGSRVTVLAPAVVGGSLVAHVPSQDALQVSSSATVRGDVRTEIRDGPGHGPGAEPGLGSFYAWQAVRFGAAFLTGLIVLALAASLRRATPGTSGTEVLTTAGVGLVAMVATPIIAVIVAITLIGIPLAVLMFLVWVVALYFSKILFSHYLGRTLFARAGRQPHFALSLLVGLLIVLTVTSVPLIGGIVSFVLTATGLGMLAIFVWGRFRGPRVRGRSSDDLEPHYP